MLKHALLISAICISLYSTISCSPKDNKDAALLSAAQSLEKSSQLISQLSKIEYEELKDKISNPTTRDRAERWLPKAADVLQADQRLCKFIKQLKVSLRENSILPEEKAIALCDSIRWFKDIVQGQQGLIPKEYSQNISNIDDFIETSVASRKSAYIHFFKSRNALGTRLSLVQLQNNLSVISRQMIGYYNDQTTRGCVLDFSAYSAIFGQSSSIVLPGEKITITAGIGAFSKTDQPKITVGGKEVTVADDGAARYHFKAFAKPGKYTVPVR